MNDLDYEKSWKQVSEFESKGLPESALKVVNSIYDQAKKEKNAGQLVKAVIHQLKFVDYKEEDALIKNLNRVREESRSAEFPAKPILHSMLGEIYWQYYQNNRHRFYNRTETVNTEEGDIETWTLEKIVQETFREYQLSLESATQSKTTSLDPYDVIIYEGNALGRKYRPTLYDFLAHRALTFFSGEEPSISRPAYAFTLDNENYLADARTFSSLRLETKDTLSTKFQALLILRELIAFHIDDKDPDALVNVDLQRLQFVKAHLTLPSKNDLYLKALEQLEKQTISYPVSTRVTYHIALHWVEMGGAYNPLQGDAHKWDLKKASEIAEGAKKRFRDSDGAIECENLQGSLLQKSIGATIEKNNIPGQAFRSLVHYKNLTTLHYRIIKITRDEVRNQRKKWERDYNVDREQKFVEYFSAKAPLKTGNYTLPDDGDFQQHSIEVKLDALPAGEYMVLFSHDAKFKSTGNGMAYAFTTITNIAYIHRPLKDGSTECYVLHRETGEPTKATNVDLYTYQYNDKKNSYDPIKIASYASDNNGHFNIPFLKNENRRNFIMNFYNGTDFNSTEDIDMTYYYYGNGTIGQYKQYDPERHTQTFFFLDRAIYRPGQTIYFKGLIVDTDGKTPKIKARYSTTITLYDVNYQEQGTVHVTTNEYGTFNATLNAPSSGLTGEMQLQNLDGSGSTSFSVEEYKRPKFEVTFEPLKGTFRLEETIRSTGRATAYSGAQIDGAAVQYRVVREARFPFWWWCRWGYYPPSPPVEIANGTTTTDVNGNFHVEFAALPDKTVDRSSDPIFDYTVYADVTDINGETHSQSTTISVGYKALQVNVPVPNINKDSTNQAALNINTTNLAGQFEPAKGKIVIYSLKAPSRTFRERLWDRPDRQLYTQQEYYSFFPHDQYAEETNRLKWERDKQVFTIDFDTEKEKSFKLNDVAKWNNGEYVLEITSKDKYGQDVKEVTYFTVFAPSAKTIATPATHAFNPIKLVVEPGNKAIFSTGTTAGKIKVLYEVERDGVILTKDWITLNNEQHVFEIPVREEDRGNLGVHYSFIRNNRLYTQEVTVVVPYTNKQLDITFETFRNKLQPGEKEQWKIRIKGKTAEKISAEMVASLYDASLDVFRFHSWYAGFYNSFYSRLQWQSINGFVRKDLTAYSKDWNRGPSRYADGPSFDALDWFGYSFYRYYESRRYRMAGGVMKSKKAAEELEDAAPAMAMAEESAGDAKEVYAKSMDTIRAELDQDKAKGTKTKEEDFSDVKVRSNFNETAFFYPTLQTNAEGEIIVNFTVPEALTRWKMLGFAHTQDLKSGLTTNELVTQKDLMVVPNPPRFFRENDKMTFSVKISSLTDIDLNGHAQLEFLDALTMKPVAMLKDKNTVQNFSVKAKQSTSVEWKIEIPEGMQALLYRVVAKAGNFSDGEEMVLPVVTNRMLVTESLPLPIRGKQTKTFRFEKLLNNKSMTLRHQRYTLEFTSNPAWYAIQALPYLMEYPYECVEQTFSRYYANSIAAHVANSNPRIKQVFDTWKNIQPDALLSNLEKNQELKSALLEETPWVLQASNESQRKRMVGLLFDLNRMGAEMDKALDKVQKAQNSSGGFSWFPGFPPDRYMTQHIINGMGHLDVLGVKSVREDSKSWNMVTKGLEYLDREITDDYERLKAAAKRKEIKLEDNHIGYLQFHYLYTRSAFKDVAIEAENKEAFNYFLGQAKKYWLNNNIYMEGMACLALYRFGEKETAKGMIKSFTERSLNSEEMGMYWKSEHGYYWYQAPIETQALMIEVYDEVAGDTKSVEDMKVWLLKQKQTTDWKTTKATVEACYALLRRGTDALASSKLVEIKIDNKLVDPTKRPDASVEAGTGYFKTAWQAGEITSGMGKIEVTKTDEGVAWGAVYWQYFEQLDKITPAETPLKLKKELFLQQNTDRGPVITPVNEKSPLKVGDLVKVRIELRVDRNMEYVHLKDMRAAGFEPIATLSTYKFQDGLYYYESPRDLATNFFIGYLPKGTYVFEYALRVSQQGDFSNGITTIQCMYAPEFSSHSAGIRVTMGK